MPKNNNPTRYFYIGIVAANHKQTKFAGYAIETINGFPSIEQCVKCAKEENPTATQVTLLSISEIPSEEWEQFNS